MVLSDEVSESEEKGDHSLPTSPRDDVDESNVQEDVKVCDICGDAGREDMLAVCGRCSDGAEHTYCMRDMLDKVPEGDWLCEECRYNEALKARRSEHLKLLGTERSKSFRRTTSLSSDMSSKLDSKDSFNERGTPRIVSLCKQLSLKRGGDNIEGGPTGKKQIIESSTGSPTVLSPSRMPVLLKDCSFKKSDKTKGKSTSQFSTGTESGEDSSENARSPTRNSEGNFVKPNSFSSSKANIKGSEEVVQKKKLIVDVKDGPGKLIGKSTSFKGLGRSSLGEPRVKMLSPNCAPVQELKGQKQIRDHNSIERKNSIKLENSFSGQTKANFINRLSRGDNISMSSVNNNRDYKNGQPNGKVTSLSNQASNSRECTGLSSTNISGSGASNSTESNPSHVSSKDGPTFSSSRSFDGSYGCANGTKADIHDRSNEKSLENAFSRSKKGANAALIGGNRQGLSLDTSTLRAKDGVHEENKLKAAIEAAMQKKQDIFMKNKVPEKLSGLPMSNSQGNHEENAASNQTTDLMSKKDFHMRDTRFSNYISNSRKRISIGSVKQLKNVDFLSSSGFDRLTMSSIPEQEAVWQGDFEIHRNGKSSDIFSGFQAYLSSSSSDKVLEVVRKLPKKIVFNEVPRPYVWPFQCKEASAQDDNIALYFFAKDHDSYMRSYKILLEYMMKHDLSLKGYINGLELLIFPSNYLPNRSQCWNTLFFMWGVFRGRRGHCPNDRFPPLERPQRVGLTSLTSPTSQIHLEKRSGKYSLELIAEAHLESGTTALEDHTQLDHTVVQHQRPLQNGEHDCTTEEKSCKILMQENQCVDNIKKNESHVDINVDQMMENKDLKWKSYEVEENGDIRLKQEGYVDINVPVDCSVEDLDSMQCSPKKYSHEDTVKLTSDDTKVITSQKRSWMDDKNLSEGNGRTFINKRIKGTDISRHMLDTQMHDVSTSSHNDFEGSNEALEEKLKFLNPGSVERSFFLLDSHDAQIVQLESRSSPQILSLLGNENRLPVGSPDLELALGVEKKQSRKGGVLPFFAEVIDRKDLDKPPYIAPPKDYNEDASASLSLSLFG